LRRVQVDNADDGFGVPPGGRNSSPAATAETRAHVPCNIVLVDAIEGFRMMAHGAQNLAIGDEVLARSVSFARGMVPYFVRRE